MTFRQIIRRWWIKALSALVEQAEPVRLGAVACNVNGTRRVASGYPASNLKRANAPTRKLKGRATK